MLYITKVMVFCPEVNLNDIKYRIRLDHVFIEPINLTVNFFLTYASLISNNGLLSFFIQNAILDVENIANTVNVANFIRSSSLEMNFVLRWRQ